MLGFFRKSGEQKRCGIYFTSIPPLCGPLVLLLLGEFHLMLFNLVGFQFVIQRGWIRLRGVESD